MHNNPTIHAKHGRTVKSKFGRKFKRPNERTNDIENRSQQSIWPDETIKPKKGFYDLADISKKFQEKIDRTLEYSTPAWLDDIIVVTQGDQEEHEKKLFDVLKKLGNAGYRASERKS